MRILGIDPGLANTGWGIIDFDGHRFQPISYGTVKTVAGEKLELRISRIAEQISEIAKQNNVTHVSMEDIFFAKNEISAIGVAKVIGAICFAMYQIGVEVSIFTPLQIKQAITGAGRADKKQVQEMCRLFLGLEKIPRPDHAADALSAAVCWCNTGPTLSRLGVKK